MELFIRGIQDLPDDILEAAVLEKFASAEKSHHQLLLATWDLEEMRCRIPTLEKIQSSLEHAHSLTQSEYVFWLRMYTDRGLPDLKEDKLFYGEYLLSATQEADRDATELTVMMEHAQEHGLGVGTFADDDDIHRKGLVFGEDLECGWCDVSGTNGDTMQHDCSEDDYEDPSD
ncbi:hypothetical protein JVU11DRAFT_6039 [Chiua virens]|nr:hypothetical protein JVU11DRAFT_6039 [Chiua virens]